MGHRSDFMPKKRTQVLCTIPLPMPLEQFVEITQNLVKAFENKGKTYFRNGAGCCEIFRYVDDGPDEPELYCPPTAPR